MKAGSRVMIGRGRGNGAGSIHLKKRGLCSGVGDSAGGESMLFIFKIGLFLIIMGVPDLPPANTNNKVEVNVGQNQQRKKV